MAGGGLYRAASANRAHRATRKPTTWALDELTDRKVELAIETSRTAA